jgi:hypothetical protein
MGQQSRIPRTQGGLRAYHILMPSPDYQAIMTILQARTRSYGCEAYGYEEPATYTRRTLGERTSQEGSSPVVQRLLQRKGDSVRSEASSCE